MCKAITYIYIYVRIYYRWWLVLSPTLYQQLQVLILFICCCLINKQVLQYIYHDWKKKVPEFVYIYYNKYCLLVVLFLHHPTISSNCAAKILWKINKTKHNKCKHTKSQGTPAVIPDFVFIINSTALHIEWDHLRRMKDQNPILCLFVCLFVFFVVVT